mgnify:CR=1 FL=1
MRLGFLDKRHGRLDAEPLGALTDDALAEADAALILTDHDAVDYQRVASRARLVIDTRNATKDVKDGREKIVRA